MVIAHSYVMCLARAPAPHETLRAGLARARDARSLVTPCRGECVGTADDLADFLGDLGLPSLVGEPACTS